MLRYLFLFAVVGFAVFFVCLAGQATKKNSYISVAAGAWNRKDSVVSFQFPATLKGKSYGLKDETTAWYTGCSWTLSDKPVLC